MFRSFCRYFCNALKCPYFLPLHIDWCGSGGKTHIPSVGYTEIIKTLGSREKRRRWKAIRAVARATKSTARLMRMNHSANNIFSPDMSNIGEDDLNGTIGQVLSHLHLFCHQYALFSYDLLSKIWAPTEHRVFIKYCVFSKNSRKFATFPSPSLGCYWLIKKITSQ